MKIFPLLIFFVSTYVVELKIVKQGKGYQNIIVAIHKSVPEDEFLIDKIKMIFQNASSLLYKATSNQAYFRDITIVVPDTWNDKPHYGKVYGEFFSKSNIRIDNSNEVYGDVPYTLQTGTCGKPNDGDYIHLTPGYIHTVTSGQDHIYGPTDRLIVHEWAHLRYGIFDEYGTAGDPTFPMFYLENGKVRTSSCSENIRGWIESTDGQACEIYQKRIFSKNCRFIPDTSNDSIVSSLMSFNYLPGVTEFCDESPNGVRKHNNYAPTKQNYFCEKSAWEVITSHEDFAGMNNINTEDYIPPIFRIVRPNTREQRFVFVLDTSSSMSGNRINALHRATVKLIEDIVPVDSYVSIVTYSSSASIVQPLIQITDSNRKAVSSKVPSSSGGYTAMGQGLQSALKVIRDSNQATDGAVFVLVSDGEENRNPYSSLILPEILKAKIIVHTIAIDVAKKNLEEIADKTGGKTYYFKSADFQTSVLDGILESTVEQSIDLDMKKEQLMRKEVSTTSTVTQKVTIDKELGNNTIFTVSGQINNVHLEAYGPKGERYNYTSPGYNKDTGVKSRIQLVLPYAEPGEWTLQMLKSDSAPIKIDVSVSSEPKDIKNQPVRIMSYLGNELIKYPETGAIYARIYKGAKIVIGAKVLATVSRPGAAPVQLELFDDGTGADREKDDGIYSRYFTRYTQNGRYSFSISMSNPNETARVINSRYSGISPLPIKSSTGKRLNLEPSNEFDIKLFVEVSKNDDKIEDQAESLGPIEREEPGTGVIVVTDLQPLVDKMPPNKVTDLKVVTSTVIKTGEMTFTIEWTSPGDNMDDGNASSLDIRISLNANDLRKDKFDTAFKVNESHIIEGTIIPVPVREIHRIVVKVPNEIVAIIDKKKTTIDIFVALRAADASNNIADISNIITLHFGYKIPEKSDLTPQPEVKDPSCKRRLTRNKLLLSLIVDLDNIDEI